MDHSHASDIKIEPLDMDYDYTHNFDHLVSDNNVHMKTELLQDVKGHDQATNLQMQENMLANGPVDNKFKIEQVNIKAEGLSFETSVFDDVLDSYGIIEGEYCK